MSEQSRPPLIAITADVVEGRLRVSQNYARCVSRAGGMPVVIGPDGSGGPDAARLVERFAGFVFTGGDDPRTEPFGEPTHPMATVIDQGRQAFEIALLGELGRSRPDAGVLGVCLGMQLMALAAGGRLLQHLPDSIATAEDHRGDRVHAIIPETGVLVEGEVTSHHHQGIASPGRLRIAGRSPDGLIEAVHDPARQFYLGVQWHPERTPGHALGQALFDALVAASRTPRGAVTHG